MSGDIPASVPTGERDGWTTATSQNGDTYVHKSIDPTPDQPDSVSTREVKRVAGWYEVDWPVQSDDEWRDLSDELKNALGISRYRLREVNGWIFKYQLDYVVLWHGEFNFQDDENDVYTKQSFHTGEYSLSYNSNKPRIVRVH